MTLLSPFQALVPWLEALAIYYNDKEIAKRADELTELLGKVVVDEAMIERYVSAVNLHLGNLTADEWAADYANVEESIRRVARIGLESALGVTK